MTPRTGSPTIEARIRTGEAQRPGASPIPLKIKYLDEGKGVVLTAAGAVTGEEFIAASKEILSRDLVAEPYLYALVDFDSCDGVSVSTAEIRQIANWDVLASKYLHKGVVGIYAKDDLPFALARIWQVLVESTGWDTKVFRSRPEAVSWVKQLVLEKFNIAVGLE